MGAEEQTRFDVASWLSNHDLMFLTSELNSLFTLAALGEMLTSLRQLDKQKLRHRISHVGNCWKLLETVGNCWKLLENFMF